MLWEKKFHCKQLAVQPCVNVVFFSATSALAVTLGWTEDAYTGSEDTQIATGQIRPTNIIVNPISLRIIPVSYDDLGIMFPGLSVPPRPPIQADRKLKKLCTCPTLMHHTCDSLFCSNRF